MEMMRKRRMPDSNVQKRKRRRHRELKGLGPVLEIPPSSYEACDPWYRPPRSYNYDEYEDEDEDEYEDEDEDEYEYEYEEEMRKREEDDEKDLKDDEVEAYQKDLKEDEVEKTWEPISCDADDYDYDGVVDSGAERKFVQDYAEKALERYNKKNGTKYGSIQDLVGKELIGDYGSDHDWTHCNFTAEQQNGEPRKLFFVEIKDGRFPQFPGCYPETITITACRILRGKTTLGCADHLCTEVLHPTRGYRVGHHAYKGDRTSRATFKARCLDSPYYYPSD